MPAALATPYHEQRANRKTVRSAMPMCIAMLQNHAKNVVCQKVNFTWPGSAGRHEQRPNHQLGAGGVLARVLADEASETEL
jgi:hypothetical protein